jgi:hypothetical protein
MRTDSEQKEDRGMALEPVSTAVIGTILATTDEQAKAVQNLATFGTTVVEEGGELTRYAGRVLGTVPEDIVGIVLGEHLRFVRTVIARSYDVLLTKIFDKRSVKEIQSVSPSIAIPLLRAAYDENRPELQELWAGLIATAMDPLRSGRFRLSFIETLKRFDPLDALVLRARLENQGDIKPSPVGGIAKLLSVQQAEVQISVDNLQVLNCASKINSQVNFYITNYGQALFEASTS